jgi:pyruvate formate lyase activating enzyme
MCKACLVCPNNVHSFDETHKIDRSLCDMCGKCIEACKNGVLKKSVRKLGEEEYLQIVERQHRLVGENGGITFSGGEPTMQGEALIEFLKKTPIHKAIETCGYCEEELFRRVIENVDYVMFDVKIADEAMHKKYTGVDNSLILENLKLLSSAGKDIWIRVPVIPDFNDNIKEMTAIAEFLLSLPNDVCQVTLMPYHSLGASKYATLGLEYRYDTTKSIRQDTLEEFLNVFKSRGFLLK